MKGSAAKIQMTSLDDLFGGATPQAASDQIQEISLTELHSFKDHPFHVVDDEKMQEMAESVEQYGVLVPVIVRELDDDEATIIMVDSNLQREKILPSEKAFAYKLKLEAMKRKAGRPKKDNCVPLAHNLAGKKSRDILAEQVGESQDQIRRYIRLTYLLPALLQMVDDNKLAFRPAVEVSALTKEEQELLLSTMNRLAVIPTLEQAQRLKAHSQNGQLNSSVMEDVLAEKKPGAEQITLKKKCLSQYFPKNYTQQQMEEVIFSLLETWKLQQKGVLPNDSDG